MAKIIQGLKAICGACEKEFPLHRANQLKLFAFEPLACPGCARALICDQARMSELRAKGNPGSPWMFCMGGMGLCGMTFFGAAALGWIRSDGVILLGFLLALLGQVAVSLGFKTATSDLCVRLDTHDSAA